jgi:Flp pilus assembly protein TadG
MRLIVKLFKEIFRDERGSASVEFALLAIPLFIPLFLYMNNFARMSDSQDSLRTLAREAVRGFVTSSTDEVAYGVAREIVSQGAALLGYKDSLDKGQIQLHIDCSASPCISPNTRILITLTQSVNSRPDIKVSAIGYVSPWA